MALLLIALGSVSVEPLLWVTWGLFLTMAATVDTAWMVMDSLSNRDRVRVDELAEIMARVATEDYAMHPRPRGLHRIRLAALDKRAARPDSSAGRAVRQRGVTRIRVPRRAREKRVAFSGPVPPPGAAARTGR